MVATPRTATKTIPVIGYPGIVVDGGADAISRKKVNDHAPTCGKLGDSPVNVKLFTCPPVSATYVPLR